MNLNTALELQASAMGMGPGAIGTSAPVRHVEADASPSDLASHHTWQEPSSTDVTIKNWRAKRQIEKQMGRNLELFEQP